MTVDTSEKEEATVLLATTWQSSSLPSKLSSREADANCPKLRAGGEGCTQAGEALILRTGERETQVESWKRR